MGSLNIWCDSNNICIKAKDTYLTYTIDLSNLLAMSPNPLEAMRSKVTMSVLVANKRNANDISIIDMIISVEISLSDGLYVCYTEATINLPYLCKDCGLDYNGIFSDIDEIIIGEPDSIKLFTITFSTVPNDNRNLYVKVSSLLQKDKVTYFYSSYEALQNGAIYLSNMPPAMLADAKDLVSRTCATIVLDLASKTNDKSSALYAQWRSTLEQYRSTVRAAVVDVNIGQADVDVLWEKLNSIGKELNLPIEVFARHFDVDRMRRSLLGAFSKTLNNEDTFNQYTDDDFAIDDTNAD